MEFFLPGLAALLIAALIVFLVLPRFGAPVLAVLSIVLLAYGLYNHYYMFAPEYRYSTWQERLKFYAPFVMIGGLVLAVLFYMGFLFGTQGPSALPANAGPQADETVVEATNTVGNAALNATVGVTNALGLTNNAKVDQNKGVLTNLGNILGANAKPNNRGMVGNMASAVGLGNRAANNRMGL